MYPQDQYELQYVAFRPLATDKVSFLQDRVFQPLPIYNKARLDQFHAPRTYSANKQVIAPIFMTHVIEVSWYL